MGQKQWLNRTRLCASSMRCPLWSALQPLSIASAQFQNFREYFRELCCKLLWKLRKGKPQKELENQVDNIRSCGTGIQRRLVLFCVSWSLPLAAWQSLGFHSTLTSGATPPYGTSCYHFWMVQPTFVTCPHTAVFRSLWSYNGSCVKNKVFAIVIWKDTGEEHKTWTKTCLVKKGMIVCLRTARSMGWEFSFSPLTG